MRVTAVQIFFLLAATSSAWAQVTVDMHALDSLGTTPPAGAAPAPPATHPGPSAPSSPVAPRPATAPAPAPPAAAPPFHPATAAKKPPAAGTPSTTGAQAKKTSPASGSVERGAVTPLAPVVSTTPRPLPTEQPANPPAATTVPPAAVSPLPLPPPVRLVFDEGKVDLTPADEAAIRSLAHAIPTPENEAVSVLAYAAGKPDDPSTARRVSLSRGLAVRSVLLDSGVPSAQIYVRALGSAGADGPADRVELSVGRIGTVAR